MERLNRSNRALLAGLGFSLVLHLGTLLGLGRFPLSGVIWAALAPDPSGLPDPESQIEEALRLGIAESDAVSVNWIGFEEATEHLAPEGPTDQPFLSQNAGAPASPEQAEVPTPADASIEQVALPDLSDINDLFIEFRPLMEELLELAQKGLERSMQQNQPTEASPVEPTVAGGEGSGEEGEPSDRDSDPSAIVGTIDVVPGHPVAAKGLEIKTVRPRWLNLTRMTTRPDNPTVVIQFRRNGKVKSAEFEPGKSTGSEAVDGPLLDAVYAWRASGPALLRLPEGDPAATLEVRMRVILR
jgi:hypothetical protein